MSLEYTIRGSGKRVADDRLCFFKDSLQVVSSQKTFRIDLVDILGAGWTSGKPPISGNHLDTSNGSSVAGSVRKNGLNLFPPPARRSLFVPAIIWTEFLFGPELLPRRCVQRPFPQIHARAPGIPRRDLSRPGSDLC